MLLVFFLLLSGVGRKAAEAEGGGDRDHLLLLGRLWPSEDHADEKGSDHLPVPPEVPGGPPERLH